MQKRRDTCDPYFCGVIEPRSTVQESHIAKKSDTADFYIVPARPEQSDQRESFVLKLATALHRYGTPAHRLEQTMSMVMKRIGLQGDFFALPTSIFASFGRPELHRTSLIRADSGEVNLGRLSDLDKLAEEIIRGTCDVREGSERIDAIEREKPIYGTVVGVIGMGLSTGVAARVFGGGWREIAVAGVIGLMIGVLGPVINSAEPRRRVFEIAASCLAASVAVLAAHLISPMAVVVATIAGLIFLLPGMRLTTAMTEIASGHLVSGAARLTGAVMAFLSIAFGTALGNRATTLLAPPLPQVEIPDLPDYTLWLALALYPVSIGILMQARVKDLTLIAFSTVLAFGGARYGSLGFGPELGAFIGALALGLGANQVARILGRPSVLMIAPGMLLLVPGSIGYRSLTMLMENDIVTGINMAVSVALVGIAIVTGLLLANAVLPSKRGL